MKTIPLLHDIESRKRKYLFTAEIMKWGKISILASTREEVKTVLGFRKDIEGFKNIRRNARRSV